MLVSIITTCLNSGATIRETCQSIHAQVGDFELEHLVTDAGSTDSTLKILEEFASSADARRRTRIIPAPGCNQSEGINLGLREAAGGIVAYLNADDLYEPGAIAAAIEWFTKYPEKLWLVGQCSIIDAAGKPLHEPISRYKHFCLRHYSYPWLLIENFIPQPAVFLRRSAIEEVGFFSESEDLAMDYEYWLRLGKLHAPIVVPQPLAKFRRVAGTKSNTAYRKQFKDDLRIGWKIAGSDWRLWWTMPLKGLSYLRTVAIYALLYR